MPEFATGDHVFRKDDPQFRGSGAVRWATVVEPSTEDVMTGRVRIRWDDTGTVIAVDRNDLALSGTGTGATLADATGETFKTTDYALILAVGHDGNVRVTSDTWPPALIPALLHEWANEIGRAQH